MSPDCIPYYEPGERITFHNGSGALIEGKRLIRVSEAPGADGNIRCARCAAGEVADGVNTWDTPDGQKGGGIFGPGYVVPITSGAAVNAGTEVQSDAEGRVIPLGAGRAIGKAWSTVGAAGLDVKVKLY